MNRFKSENMRALRSQIVTQKQNGSTLREIAETGVDIISMGALTHSVKAFDISLKIAK